jgi:hypothetical protein
MTFEDTRHLIGKKIRFQIESQEEVAWGDGEIDFADGKLLIRTYNENLNSRRSGGQMHIIPLTEVQAQSVLLQGEKDQYEI